MEDSGSSKAPFVETAAACPHCSTNRPGVQWGLLPAWIGLARGSGKGGLVDKERDMCYPKAEVSGKGRSGCRLFADNQDKKEGSHPVVGWVFLLYLCADSVILRAPFWKGGFVPPCLQRGAFCRRTSFPRMKSESIGTRITHEGWVVRFFVYRKPLARRVVREKTYVDNEEIETPFAIIEVRSANCTKKQREVIQR